MNALTAALKEELNVDMVTVFGLSIPESVVVSWGIMAFLVIVSILLTRNLRVDHITKRQAILETVVTTINDFFVGLLGESGKRYVPYLMSVALYIGCSNLIGVFGIKPPTKDLNVTAALALMSIILVQAASIRQNKVYHAFLRTEMNEYLLVRLELFVADGVTVLNDGIDKQGGAKTCLRIFGSLSPAVFIMNPSRIPGRFAFGQIVSGEIRVLRDALELIADVELSANVYGLGEMDITFL